MIFKIIVITVSLCTIYVLYQLLRIQLVYKIRDKWIDNIDVRHIKYTYEEMLDPSKKNWYGFKYPRDKDFK